MLALDMTMGENKAVEKFSKDFPTASICYSLTFLMAL